MDQEERLIWASGFFDGEGTIGIARWSKDPRRMWLHIAVAQTSIEPLTVLRDLFGGSISVKKAGVGSLSKRPQWNWSCGRRVAAAALERMLPYLIVKRGEAELGISMQRSLKQLGGTALSPFDLAEREAVRLALMDVHRGEHTEVPA